MHTTRLNVNERIVTAMNLKLLLLIHAIVTFAAGVTLFVSAAFIPSMAGVHVSSDAYLVCYLLGAAEFAIAFLSFAARQLQENQALRMAVWTFITFHACSAAAEAYALTHEFSGMIVANVVVRVLVVAAFANFGLRRIPAKDVAYQSAL